MSLPRQCEATPTYLPAARARGPLAVWRPFPLAPSTSRSPAGAWTSRTVTSAWHVAADQVHKQRATGDRLPAGQFVILGSK